MKAQKAKMQGNEGPKGQKLENEAGPGAAKFFIWDIGKTGRFWQLVGGAQKPTPKRPKCKEMKAQKAKNCKEMKAHKAKMQGNEGPQGQNARK